MPALTEAMRVRHEFRTYYYGNFSNAVPGSASGSERDIAQPVNVYPNLRVR